MIIKKVEYFSNEIEEILVDGVTVYPVKECPECPECPPIEPPEDDNTPPQYKLKEELI